jgi:hypothetical protein
MFQTGCLEHERSCHNYICCLRGPCTRATTLEALLFKFPKTGENSNGEAIQTPIRPGWVRKAECSLSSGRYRFQKGLEVVLTMDVKFFFHFIIISQGSREACHWCCILFLSIFEK